MGGSSVEEKQHQREQRVVWQENYRSTILGNPQYDAARKHWGGKWRTPTGEDFYMLIRKCKWEEAEMNGKKDSC